MAMAKPLREVRVTVEFLRNRGCIFSVTDGALVVHDPEKVLSTHPELHTAVRENKLALLAYIQREALMKLMQVIEMAQPEIRAGLKEDFLIATHTASRVLGGDIWEEDLDTLDVTTNS